MKKSMSKKIFSLMLCFCFVALSGCGDSQSVDSATKNSETANSTSTTTSSTTKTSTSTSTSTSASTSTQTGEQENNEQISMPTVNVNGEKLIALTFDDGPNSAVTSDILDTLEKYGAKATFFVVGDRVAANKSVVKRAHDLGCEIGSHTWSHKNLTKLTTQQMNDEMKKSVDAISAVTGVPVKVMRPPEGGHNETVRNNLDYPLIMWSVDSNDWRHRNAQKDYDEVMNYVFDGAIILMHDLYPATAEAVAKLIPDLMAQGYKFVTVSELLGTRGVEVYNGKTYSSAKP